MNLQVQIKQRMSLIELLVVVAIISLLIALISPALKKVMEQARITKCSRNEYQIGLGFFQYAEDHRGLIPAGPTFSHNFMNRWIYWVYPYASGEEFRRPHGYHCLYTPTGAGMIFLCPSAEAQIIDSPVALGIHKSHYMIHFDAGKKDQWNLYCDGMLFLHDVSKPDSTLLITDSSVRLGTGHSRVHFNYAVEPPSRHRNGGNTLFFDGHVKWMAYVDFQSNDLMDPAK